MSLRRPDFAYDHDTRSVFADFEAMRSVNPLVRVPWLVLGAGETLIDSVAVLDWLDHEVGPERALIPPAGAARRQALRRIALATGGRLTRGIWRAMSMSASWRSIPRPGVRSTGSSAMGPKR